MMATSTGLRLVMREPRFLLRYQLFGIVHAILPHHPGVRHLLTADSSFNTMCDCLVHRSEGGSNNAQAWRLRYIDNAHGHDSISAAGTGERRPLSPRSVDESDGRHESEDHSI